VVSIKQMIDKSYVIKEVRKNTFDVTSFEDDEPGDAYQVSYNPARNYWHCDCRGFFMQKVKSEHKHIRMAQLWCEKLDKQPGFVFWLDGTDIEYRNLVA